MNKKALIVGIVLSGILMTGLVVTTIAGALVHWLHGGSYDMVLHINLSGFGLIVVVLLLLLSLWSFYPTAVLLIDSRGKKELFKD